MTTYKLMCWLFLGVLFLAGVVTPQNDTENTTVSSLTDTPLETIQGITTTKDGEICSGFDGPSFIGGIVLTWGIGLLLWLALKFYRTRKESNYHNL